MIKVVKGIENLPIDIYEAFRTKFRIFDMGGLPDYTLRKHIALLKDDDVIVGMLVTNSMRNRICYLAVAKEYQKKGYGRFLFEESCKLLDLNKDKMTLTSNSEDSNKFWQKMGFKIVSEHYTKKSKHKKYKMIYDNNGLIDKWL